MWRNKHKKLMSKVLLTGVIVTMVSVDIVPLFSYAKDFQYVGEETTLEETDSPETSLEDTLAEVDTDNAVQEDVISGKTETEAILEQEVEDSEIPEAPMAEESSNTTQRQTMSMQIQSENSYELATDADFSGTTDGGFRYIGNKEYVEIPSTIKGVNVTSYNYMFEWSGVKGVKSTNKNVTDMSYMFYSLQSETLDVLGLDTTNVTNMTYMFGARSIEGKDSMLKYLDLSNFYTGNAVYTNSMFSQSLVMDLDLSSFDTSNVTNMNGMFLRSHAKNLDLRSFDTSKVTIMNQMFYEVKGEEIDVSSFDTSNVTSMNYMFGAQYKGWSNLRVLDITNFNTSKVTDMGEMFAGTLLKELDLSRFDTANVTNMSSMFYQSDIVNIDLSSFDTGKVSYIGRMFNGTQATNIDLSSFNTSNIIDMTEMFKDSQVKNLNLSSFDTSNVYAMTGMFSGSAVEELDLTSFNTSKVTNMIDMFRDSDAIKIDLSSFNTAGVTTMGFMFYKSKVQDLGLSNFNTSKVTNMSYMFSGTSATHIDVSNFDTRNVISMANLFEDSKAGTLDLSSFNTERITDMSDMFKKSQAKTINLSSFDTKYVINMDAMFQYSKVENLDLRSFDMRSVNETDNMFSESVATSGVARSKEDEVKLNNSQGKPESLVFTTLYKLATDEDFSGFYNGNFRYTGTEEYVEMSDIIKGASITSYANLFENTTVKGVISKNKNVTTMSNMFKGNKSNELDVTSIDTANVTDMSGMFQNTSAIVLDLRNFITTNITNTSKMFEGTKISEVDLGSFDLTKLNNTSDMFQNTEAKVGYARTQEDINKLNASSNKPSTLNFTTWGIITNQSVEDWTNSSVDIAIKAESGLSGIKYVEMVNEPGRNLLKGTVNGNTGEFYKGMGITSAKRTVETSYTNTYSNTTINPLLGDTYTLSFYAKNSKEAQSFYSFFYSPNTTLFGNNSQGVRIDSPDGQSLFTASTEWERYWVTYTQTPASTNKNIIAGRMFGLSDMSIAGVKLEEGDTPSPWTPAPEDSENTGDQKDVFKVYSNGTYIFRATDTSGNTKTVAHKVTNIDTENPTAKVTSSPDGWTSQDVTIYVNAEDTLSGVDYIALPNGEKVYDSKVEYPATENGTYTFKVTDKAGNETTYTETITNIDKTIPKLTATPDNTKWTTGTVNISVESDESASGLTGIDMISSPIKGQNLMNHTGGTSGVREHGYYYDEILKEDGKESYVFTNDSSGGRNIAYLGFEDYKLQDGKEYTFSFYAKANKPIKLREENGVYIDEKNLAFLNGQDISTEWERYSFSFIAKGNGNVNVHMYPKIHDMDATFYITEWKLEEGSVVTPWSPAPKDVNLSGNKKVYPVEANGLYTYKSTYNNGMTSEASVNVTNIDRTKPEVTVTGNKDGWTEEEKLTLTLNAKDTQSGVQSIQLPDGSVVTSATATYDVAKNGDYTFIVTDTVGNKTTHTEKVEYLMIPYSFYIYDSKGNPVEGAEFELLRNNEYYKTAKSASDGLVDFGRIPPSGSYRVRQVTAPGGVIIDPEDIESGDVTEPIEVVSYPRGITLPSSGTLGLIGYVGATLVAVVITLFIQNRKNKLK